jgi:ferric-dicitrate binding protein FerR (iron transport regulator)
MDYREYEAEDLLLDPSFCDYCRGKDNEAKIFWEEWIADHPERNEVFRQARELYSLLNGNHNPLQYFEDEQAFRATMKEHLELDKRADPFLHEEILATGNFAGEPGRARAETLGTSLDPVGSFRPVKRSLRKIWLYAGSLAATVVLVIGIRMLMNPMASRPVPLPWEYARSSKTGERKSFQLPDGSQVMLNSGSKLKIAKEFNVSMREIWLEGEAFFDVTHIAGRPFVIHTSSMDVKVLGTTFNIRDYPSDRVTETSLLKGSVIVTVKGEQNKEILLHPNEKIVLSNDKEVVSSSQLTKTSAVSPEKKYKIATLTYNQTDSSLVEVSWTENRLAFNETSFDEIAVELERWYNVSIRFADDSVKQYRFTAAFEKNTLPQVLHALQLSRHFEYEIKGDNQVIIK